MQDITYDVEKRDALKNLMDVAVAEVSYTHLFQFKWKDEESDGLGDVRILILEHNNYHYLLANYDYHAQFITIYLLVPEDTWLNNPPKDEVMEFLKELELTDKIRWFNDWYYLTMEDKISYEVRLNEDKRTQKEMIEYLMRRYNLSEEDATKHIQ